jgi:DNA/RNA endonuclease YhcR with UshA esterase domain
MKKIAFVAAVLGIGILMGMMLLPPSGIMGQEDIDSLDLNSKVVLSGKVESERDFDGFKVMRVNGVDVVCNCEGFYLGKEVEVKGIVDEFEGKKQVRAIEVSILYG